MHEINLVPDIKIQMLKAIRLRNLMFFICIIVVAVSAGTALLCGTVAGGQRVAMSVKKDRIEDMSKKLSEYTSLSEFLTIQSQLENISTINNNRNSLSRIFNLLDAIVPHGADSDQVTISQLTISLEDARITLDAQADARKEPNIDYRVLESFKKGVGLTTYDYGRYVTEEGTEIPTYCIVEADEDGNTYKDEKTGGIYAIWNRDIKGCDPDIESQYEEDDYDEDGKYIGDDEELEGTTLKDLKAQLREELDDNHKIEAIAKNNNDSNNNTSNNNTSNNGNATPVTEETGEVETETEETVTEENPDGEEAQAEEEEKVEGVKIWRTPLFADWYTHVYTDGTGQKVRLLQEDGTISGVAHFESQCITYTGTQLGDEVRWATNTSEECQLTEDGMTVSDSSNGKNADDQLVLRFSATIDYNPEIFKFTNKHMMIIGPEAQNVTDSYKQLEGIFGKAATACTADDPECIAASGVNDDDDLIDDEEDE